MHDKFNKRDVHITSHENRINITSDNLHSTFNNMYNSFYINGWYYGDRKNSSEYKDKIEYVLQFTREKRKIPWKKQIK